MRLSILAADGYAHPALWAFLIYTVAVFVIAAFSNRLLRQKSFLSEYFLGSRGLGTWAFALTFAATSASGGTFTGFPAKIYTHGWILAVWIASYMVYPLCTMGFLGKRLNQVARKSGAITVPDVLRDRFESPAFGLLSTSLILFFLSVNLIAQFKAGSVILQTLIQDVDQYQALRTAVAGWIDGVPFFAGVNPGYLTCLVLFGVAVIFYTTYGGFHAVVWTDVMQGIVMVVGVFIMLPLAISQVGGLTAGTQALARMTPPRLAEGTLELPVAPTSRVTVSNLWLTGPPGEQKDPSLYHISGVVSFAAGERQRPVKLVEIRTPEEKQRIRDRILSTTTRPQLDSQIDSVGDATSPDGFSKQELHDDRAAASGAVLGLWPPRFDEAEQPVLLRAVISTNPLRATSDGNANSYVTGPGPLFRSEDSHRRDGSMDGFLPLGLAISFYFMWAISGTGQPQYMVRLMAFKDSTTLRRAIAAVTIYYGAIYLPLVLIFCLARLLLPGMEHEADKIMPAIAVELTSNAGHPWLAGLLIAAPFAAVMSTVDSYLLVISSSAVRDVYQRTINPDASEKTIKRLSYLTTLAVGSIALVFTMNPPEYLQDIIVYVGSGLAACFLFPVVAALYFPRANVYGCVAGMLGGFVAHLIPHAIAKLQGGSFAEPVNLLGLSPVLLGLGASLLATLVVTPLTPPPEERLVRKYFYRET